MVSKTPRFDKALDEYFANIKLDEQGGQWRTCRFSGKRFYIRPEDVSFYKRIRVPLPTLNPMERLRRRLAYQNTYNLFRTKSSSSGKTIIASYPPSTPFTIVEHQTWASDKTDPLLYGREYDHSQGFFEQFAKLQRDVPRPNLSLLDAVNSDYANRSGHIKDCYLVFDASNSEDCWYSSTIEKARNVLTCDFVMDTEIAYRCKYVEHSARVFFCEESKNCMDSYFLYECKNCTNCFGCANLQGKQYYFFNEYLGKEAYEKKLASINLGNREVLKHYTNKFEEIKKRALRPATRNQNATSSLGSGIVNSTNCYQCLVAYNAEHVAYSFGFLGYRDCYDMAGGINGELSYESFGLENQYNVLFSSDTFNGRTIEYCDLCRNVSNCFGCVGLRNKKFCIFNKQYAESEYWKTVDEIKTAMMRDKTYGEFFPPQYHPIPYTISVALAFPGFGDIENAKRYGYDTQEIPEEKADAKTNAVLPLDIKDASDDILTQPFFDARHKKQFRFIKPELEFHRQHNLALPDDSPLAWLAEARKSPAPPLCFDFSVRSCPKCGASIQTTYEPDQFKDTVFCEQCYQAEVV